VHLIQTKNKVILRTENMTEEFWNRVQQRFEPFELNPMTLKEKASPGDRIFFNFIGEVKGRNVLDIGCGNGLLSVYLAKMGNKVTAIDKSQSAIRNTISLAKANDVETLIAAQRLDIFELESLNRSFDLVVGKFILHHIEPFDKFVGKLFNMITKGGKGIFYENNSRNPILLFFRTFLVGRFGIPKLGDSSEHPFEPKEIEMLGQKFDRVNVYYPGFKFFVLMSPYLFKNKHGRLINILGKMDQWIYDNFPFLHRYSYHQMIEIDKF
jgi:2-polyprenyl-3-methyl-5-hydroxy-6-metoxy-1,4-benzoquinol methylase